MALNQGTTYIRLEGDLTPLQRDLKSAEVMTTRTGTRVESRFKRVGSSIAASLGTAAKRGLQAAGVATVAWAGYSIKAASDVGEAANKATVIFGKNAAKVLEWSETTASAFGISKAEALETSASFGAMLDTAGIAGVAMADMSVDLVELASDMASFNNQDPSEMLDRLRSGLAGEAEPLRRFGVFISEAAIQTQALKDGLIEQGEEMDEATKVQARYNLILDQTTKQQGDFARTSDAMPNQIRKLKASFADVSAELGEKLLPVAVQVLEWLNENLPAAIGFVSDVMRGWSRLWNNTVEFIGDAVASIMNIFQEFLRVFINIAGGIVDAAAFAFGWLPGIGSKIRRFRDQFHATTEGILEDLEDQITRFENWGKTSVYELARTDKRARGTANAILSITEAIKGLAQISIPGGIFTTPSGPDLPGGGIGGGFLGTGLVSIGRNLQSQGFRVTGHPAFPPVGAHTEGSLHYIGRAIDVNWGAAGESPEEKLVLNSLAAKFRATLPHIAELIYPATGDPEHQDHLHLAMDMGGIVKGPAMIAQGNITEAHIPLSGPGAGGMRISGVLEIPGLGRAILRGAHLSIDQRNHQDARASRWQASVAT